MPRPDEMGRPQKCHAPDCPYQAGDDGFCSDACEQAVTEKENA